MKFLFLILNKLLPMIVFILVVMEIVVCNDLAGQGSRLNTLEDKIAQEKNIQEDLTTRIASASSLTTIRQQATEMGLSEPSKSQVVSLVPDQFPVAFSFTR